MVAVDGTYLTTFDAETRKNETDLYNSGASQHMSGFHHKFINLVKIKPIPITATNKRTFQATAKGELLFHIPNGDKGISKVHLLEALYSLSMGVTLVSVRKIMKAGSMVLFQGSHCQIYDKAKVRIGEIPERNGLYCVYKANSVDVEDKLLVNDFHQCLGHISQD